MYKNHDTTQAVIVSCRQHLPVIRIIVIVAVLAITLFSPLGLSQAEAQEVAIHVVKPGENLSQIANRYGVSYVQLARHNRISNVNHIYVGQRLSIPIKAKPIYVPNTTSVTIVPSATPIPKVVAPVITSPAAPARSGEAYYTVRRGDSISSIAVRYGVSESAIMQRNNLVSSLIVVGQRLIIPGNVVPAPVVTAIAEPAAPEESESESVATAITVP